VHSGDFPFKQAKDVTEADIKERNLILFGTAESNPLIAEFAARLPVQCTAAGVSAVAKNTKAPRRFSSLLIRKHGQYVWSGQEGC